MSSDNSICRQESGLQNLKSMTMGLVIQFGMSGHFIHALPTWTGFVILAHLDGFGDSIWHVLSFHTCVARLDGFV